MILTGPNGQGEGISFEYIQQSFPSEKISLSSTSPPPTPLQGKANFTNRTGERELWTSCGLGKSVTDLLRHCSGLQGGGRRSFVLGFGCRMLYNCPIFSVAPLEPFIDLAPG